MIGILLGILTFFLLVLLHEFGHFLASKKSGVQVKEFGIGLPPKALTLWKDKSGTEYTLNWIPLGGFVSLKGEEGDSGDPDSFVSAKLWKKLVIISAGVIMNFLTAFVLLTVLFKVGMKPISVLPDHAQGIYSESYLMPSQSFLKESGFLSGESEDSPIVVDAVIPDGIAESIGIQVGDTILRINDQLVSVMKIHPLLAELQDTQNNTIVFSSFEGKEISKIFDCPGECLLGVAYQSASDIEVLPVKFGWGGAMFASLHEIKAEWDLTMSALGKIGKNLFSFDLDKTKTAVNQLTGPVGAVKFGEQLFQIGGLVTFLGFAAMLSIALAIFNILPIPALDGGRFWALIIQKLFRIKDEKFSLVEGWVNTVFFWFLVLLGIVIILKDLVVWWGVHLPFL